ncbi:MAG TPA: HD domain-containing protein [Spongiibacteraceae bacterium]|nr:HD domain-containing protein [Spongiibacteraceae bacterium]
MEKQLAFLLEIDKLKNVVRKSPLIDQSRNENSAEHSWHLALYALILAGTANTEVNVDRVIRMLLIHDIVEIDAGDHPIHESKNNDLQKELEQRAARRIFGLLPDGLLPNGQGAELMQLWQEFEAGTSDDAAFAKSLDRFQPLMHNIATGGGTWTEANVTKDQVIERYGPTIAGGSIELWTKAEQLVKEHFE